MDEEAPISLADASTVLRGALFALAFGDVGALELFTDDVCGDSPNLFVRSKTELGYQLLDRAGALSNVEFDLDPVVMDGPDTFLASWRVTGDHTGDALLNEDVYFQPTGKKIRLSVSTRVEFRQRRIAAFRTSYADGDLFSQIRGDAPPAVER